MTQRLPMLIGIVLVLSALSIASMMVPMPHADSGPVLTLAPNYGSTGTTVTLSGSGFTPGPSDCVGILGSSPSMSMAIGTCTIDGSRTVSGSFVLLDGNSPGAYVIMLESAQAIFALLPVTTITTTVTDTETSTSTKTETSSTTRTVTTVTTTVPVPTLVLSPTWGALGANVSLAGANYRGGPYCILQSTPSSLFTSQSCSISSGVLTGGFTVQPSALFRTYNVTVNSVFGVESSALFSVVPSTTFRTTATSTVQGPTVTSTSTQTSTTTTSVPTTVFLTATSYLTTTTGPTLTVYSYTVTQTYGATVTTVPTSTMTIYGVETESRATGVTTVEFEQTVTKTLQNTVTVGGGTSTTFQLTTQNKTVQRTVTGSTTTITPTETQLPATVTTTVYTSSQIPEPTGPDYWTIGGIIALAVIGIIILLVVGMLWLRRRRGGKSAMPKAGMSGRTLPTPPAGAASSPILAVPVVKKESGGHVATAPTASDGSITCKGCGARIEKGEVNCQICATPRKESEQEATPARQEQNITEIQRLTSDKRNDSKIGPLKNNGAAHPKEEKK